MTDPNAMGIVEVFRPDGSLDRRLEYTDFEVTPNVEVDDAERPRNVSENVATLPIPAALSFPTTAPRRIRLPVTPRRPPFDYRTARRSA